MTELFDSSEYRVALSEDKAMEDYPTPGWVVRRLLEALDLPEGLILEPFAGRGSIMAELEAAHPGRVAGCEIQSRHAEVAQGRKLRVVEADGLRWLEAVIHLGLPCGVVTNPPFALSEELVRNCRGRAWLAMYQRVTWLGSRECAGLLQAHPAGIFVLPDRAKHKPGSNTDNAPGAWFVWGIPSVAGRVIFLNGTPKEERQKDYQDLFGLPDGLYVDEAGADEWEMDDHEWDPPASPKAADPTDQVAQLPAKVGQ